MTIQYVTLPLIFRNFLKTNTEIGKLASYTLDIAQNIFDRKSSRLIRSLRKDGLKPQQAVERSQGS